MKKTLAAALSTALLLLLAAPLLSRQGPPDDESLIGRLDWMEGRWVIDGGGQFLEETWGPAREDALVGSLRWARKGSVWLYELMSIEADEEHGLVFRLRHFNRGLEPWASEKDGPLTYPLLDLDDARAVFENPERDQPRRIVYAREDDTLTIRLEDPDGETDHPFVFRLARWRAPATTALHSIRPARRLVTHEDPGRTARQRPGSLVAPGHPHDPGAARTQGRLHDDV